MHWNFKTLRVYAVQVLFFNNNNKKQEAMNL